MNLFSSHDAEQFASVVQLSSGTRLAVLADEGPLRYRPGAIIPREPWRAARAAILASLFDADEPWRQDRSIAIARLPAEQRLAIERLGLASRPRDVVNSSAVTSLAGRKCLEIVAEFFRCSSGTRCYGIGINGPGMATTSIDRNIDRIVGIHVDHWDQLPLTARPTANNRLAINVGESSYYFLVLPTTLAEMTRLLGLGVDDGVDLNELPARFMAAFPDRPVCRFEIAPGDIYIAPTDNLIHDGSTTGVATESRQIVFRGIFEPTEAAFRSLFREWRGRD